MNGVKQHVIGKVRRMPASRRSKLTNQNNLAGMGPWKVHLIFVFLLYCLLNYWYIAESYTATPETRMNLDRSLNWLGSIYFILWAATPLMAWGLFLWALVTGLKQYALYLPWKNAATVRTPDSSACSPIIFSAVRVALAVSVLFGAARLSLDIFEINFYAVFNLFNRVFFPFFQLSD